MFDWITLMLKGILSTILLAIIVIFLLSILVYYLWNAVVPDVFNLSPVTFKQAVLLTFLIKILINDTKITLSTSNKTTIKHKYY
jgi:uncharacterized membrane protein